jgi:hypothetical protein
MIICKCATQDSALLASMQPFQGELKKRTEKDIDDLKESILADGLLMPFALWQNENILHILDGHGRYAALIKIALQDPTVLTQQFPAVIIESEDETSARKALLQIVSSYGRISKVGLGKFASNIVDYKAPVLTKLFKPVKYQPMDDTFEVIRIKLPKSISVQVREILKTVAGVEVL